MGTEDKTKANICRLYDKEEWHFGTHENYMKFQLQGSLFYWDTSCTFIPSHVYLMWSLQQSWDLDSKPHFAYEEAEAPSVRRLLREGEDHAEGAILSAHACVCSDGVKWIYQTGKEMRTGLQIRPDGKPRQPAAQCKASYRRSFLPSLDCL